MQQKTTRRLGYVATAAAAALGLFAVSLPLQPAQAQATPFYLGWDFGNGWGVGIGTPPSAYGYHYCGLTPTMGPCYNYW